MNMAESITFAGSAELSALRSCSIASQRVCSPESFSSSSMAAPSTSSAFWSDALSRSASAVFVAKSSLRRCTFSSRSRITPRHLSSRSFEDASSACSSSFARKSGSTLISTAEYSRFALTQDARGEAATDTRWMTACSNELPFFARRSSTPCRISGVIFRESKLRISSLTERLPRNLFIEIQEVSKLPISRSTPSSTSLMGSGGILSDRISLRLSLLMPLTARLASSSSGCTSSSSASTFFFRTPISTSSVLSFCCSVSTSPRRSTARSIDFCICSIAASASLCFTVSSARCSVATRCSLSTSRAASVSLVRPPRSLSIRSVCWARSARKTCRHMSQNAVYCLGVPPRGSCIRCIASMLWTRGPRCGSGSCASSISRKTVSRGRLSIAACDQPACQIIEHRVYSAGLDSHRCTNVGFDGFISNATCRSDRTRAVKKSKSVR
mmetsp:Transcript_10482/g.34773  ORF Transcript_10482/g.34773 Transcript_10482/m.34773 type:complete len:441 (+) Transcript_10482:3489-4811(+)